MPDMPEDNKMMNFGLTLEQQVFKPSVIPANIATWDASRVAAFVDKEWHIRRNGYWIFIKGERFYIPGRFHVYLSYWWSVYGGLPKFRMEGLDFFQVWEFAWDTPTCFGVDIIKCRGVGDTDKALFCCWESCTRWRASLGGMQNVTDDDAAKDFARLVNANSKMPFFFRASQIGMDKPKRVLEFDFPPEANTAKRQRSEKGKAVSVKSGGAMPLQSTIDFEATKVGAYDGVRHRFYYGNEKGKVSVAKMDMREQWKVLRPVLALEMETMLVGRAILTTTVEDIEDGATVAVCRDMWKEEDPRNVDALGKTLNGLWRYFRGYELAARVDKWGFHDVEYARYVRKETIAAMLKANDQAGISNYKRKFPATIEEALETPAKKCVMYPELIDGQRAKLEEWGQSGDQKYLSMLEVQGELVWEKGFGGSVRWIPTTAGNFWISQHPIVPNARKKINGMSIPGNAHHYGMGVDPIDHFDVSRDSSDGAFAIKRVFNPHMESELLEYDEGGRILNREFMKTNRFVCVYKFRPFNPEMFFEDVLKAAIYFGCKAFIERDKPGVSHYFDRHGFGAYLAWKPKVIKIGAKTEMAPGMKSSQQSIDLYMSALQTHFSMYPETYVHNLLLQDYRNFDGTTASRRHCDLFVAAGFAEMQSNAYEIMAAKEEKVIRMTSLPINTIPTRYGSSN
jgi:hypothetical protein